MVSSDYDDDDALLEASRQAYKTRAKAAHPPADFTEGADMITFDEDPDSKIPTQPSAHAEPSSRAVRRAHNVPKQVPSKKEQKDAAHVDSSLATMEQQGVASARKPTKREAQEVCTND